MRRASLFLGLAVLALVWGGPLLDVWRDSFAAHMLAHMGVVAIAAPLIAIGLSFSPSTGRRWPEGPDEGRREHHHQRPVLPLICLPASSPRKRGEESSPPAFLSLPVVASLLELVTVWAWHAPALRALAESSTVATVVEQAMFLAAGLLLWISCLGRSGEGGVGAFGLLLTSVHMTLLGALLALSPRPLYGAGEVTCFGVVLSAGQDQEIGGVLMLMIGAAVYLAGGVALLARLLAAPAPAPKSGAW